MILRCTLISGVKKLCIYQKILLNYKNSRIIGCFMLNVRWKKSTEFNLFLISFQSGDNPLLNYLKNTNSILGIKKAKFISYNSDHDFLKIFNKVKYNYVFTIDDYDNLEEIERLNNFNELKYNVVYRDDNLVAENIRNIKACSLSEVFPDYKNLIRKPRLILHYINNNSFQPIPNSDSWIDKNGNVEADYLNLDEFLKKELRKGKIIFWSRLEHNESNKNNPSFSFTSDLRASLISKILNRIYGIQYDFNNWSEKVLNSLDYSVALLDYNGYVIWANNSRRIFHRNNIIGKPCQMAFNCSDCHCCIETCTE